MYHWKDASGREVDILIDLGRRIIPVEVKSGVTVASDAFDNLRRWTGLQNNPNEGGVLVHGGDDSYLSKGIAVLPWYLL